MRGRTPGPAVAFGVVLVTACAVSPLPCNAPPVGSVRAFFAGENAPRMLRATVERITTLEDSVAFAYELREESGATRKLMYRAREPMAGVVEGATYEFEVEFIGGFPPVSSVVVRDGQGLVFAAFTGQTPRDIDGFAVSVGDTGCSSRTHDDCHDSIVNQKLIVSRGNETVELMNGQIEEIGGYRVHVLTAQKVSYNKRCADAGLDAVSYTVNR